MIYSLQKEGDFIKQKQFFLFCGLILFFAIPAISTYPRTQLLASTGTEIFSVIGHIEWFDLIDETIRAFLLVPLYHLLSKARDSGCFWREVKEKTAIAGILYTMISMIVVFNLIDFMELMNVMDYAETNQFLDAEVAAFVLKFMGNAMVIVFTVLGQPSLIFYLAGVECASTIIFDYIMIPRFLAIGVAYSDIGAGICTMIFSILVMISHPSESGKSSLAASFQEWGKLGFFSGMQILVDNLAYALIVVRMITAVADQGNYWVANNFIWNLLLIPIMALSEIVKRENKPQNIRKFCLYAMLIYAVWIVAYPIWPWLLTSLFGITDPVPIIEILRILIPFYLAYNISVMFSSAFIAAGRTDLNFIVSLVVNLGYYGIAYGIYLSQNLEPTTTFACFLFGGGMVVNCICSLGLYSQIRTGRS